MVQLKFVVLFIQPLPDLPPLTSLEVPSSTGSVATDDNESVASSTTVSEMRDPSPQTTVDPSPQVHQHTCIHACTFSNDPCLSSLQDTAGKGNLQFHHILQKDCYLVFRTLCKLSMKQVTAVHDSKLAAPPYSLD